MPRLPRLPKSEWKETPAQTVTIKATEYNPDGPDKVLEPCDVSLPGGLYLESILIWCKCKDSEGSHYVEESDGTHGWVCYGCGGVTQVG